MNRNLGAAVAAGWLLGCGPPARLTQIESEVFARSCAFTSCHVGSSPAGSLNLEGRTHSKLINITGPSQQPLVVPGKPDASWLLTKLKGIPPAAQMPPAEALGADRIEMVRSWIAAGASDN